MLAGVMTEKEFRFAEKKVDESWKESARVPKQNSDSPREEPAHPFFANFIHSLAVQALSHMGELRLPETEESHVDLSAAQEIIDLMLMLKEKTKGNLSASETKLLDSLTADLQLKFVQHQK